MKPLFALLAGIVCGLTIPAAPRVWGQTLTESLIQEGIPELAIAAREGGDAVRGAILFSQQKLNCVKCHQSGAGDLLGPDLTQLDQTATDTYIVESLLLPSKVIKEGYEAVKLLTVDGVVLTGRVLREDDDVVVLRDNSDSSRKLTVRRDTIEQLKPSDVSSMPADLVDQLQDRQQFLDLSRYLMGLASVNATPGTDRGLGQTVQLSKRTVGLALLDQHRCVRCHEGKPNASIPPAAAPHLTDVGSRIDPNYLPRYIADPQGVKPGTSMPNVMAHLDESVKRETVESIVAYLMSRTEPTFRRGPVDAEAAKRGQETFHAIGCVACHSPKDESGKDILQETSVALGDLGKKYSVESLTQFLEDPHAVRPSGRMPNLKLTHWEAVDLANYLVGLSTNDNATDDNATGVAGDEVSGAASAEVIDRGKLAYQSLGCANCHENDGGQRPESNYPPLAMLKPSGGCLSDDADRVVQYALGEFEREAMQLAMEELAKPQSQDETLIAALHTLKCYQCHQRNGMGGVTTDRDPYFQSDDPNLGPQGRIPPMLTNVGAKLKPKWMRQVLVSGRSIRPYVQTRMPLYGLENVEPLIDLFQSQDQLPPHDWIDVKDPKESKKVGAELAGSKGLNCVACHTFQQKPAQTMQAVDLTEMAERLKRDWFERYMRDPQSLSPGTVMPSFWPGGKSIRPEILDGDTDEQVATLWLYLQDGRQARQPRGLVIEPMELLADDEAVMLRRNYPGIGKRGIGVGYATKINLAFDAEQMRLALLWRGEFADPGAAWRGQGSGTVRPLSRDITRFPVGPDLDDGERPWIVDEGRPPKHQFKGYRLDEQRRPMFRYRYDGISVEDYFVDLESDSGDRVSLKRTLRFQTETPRDGLVFRVLGSDQSMTQEGESLFRLENGLRIRIDPSVTPRVTRQEQSSSLIVPLDLAAGVTELEVTYLW